jgi:uncharacterized protein
MPIKITFDPGKRASTLRQRGLDFVEAEQVFAGVNLERPTNGKTMASCA